MFRLEFELRSFADLRRPGAPIRLGRALDSEPMLRPQRMDIREPVRNAVASAEAYLSDGRELISGQEILFERRSFPRLSGELQAPSYREADDDEAAIGDTEQPHRLRGELAEADRDWLLEASNLEAFAAWFGRLAAAFDASYGYAADHQLVRQQAGEFGRLRREKRWAPLPPGPESDRHSVRDVYWLNYFGPAFVEKWGERLTGLGADSALPTANGGVVVRATPTPFVYRDDVASFMDYEWKRPFYEALGVETFVNALTPAWVPRVPTREDHLRALGADRG